MKIIKFIFILLFFCIILQYGSNAELVIYYKNNDCYYDVGKAPIFYSKIKVIKDGNIPVIIDENNSILLESNAIINKTIKYSDVAQDGWQYLEWTSEINTVGNTIFELIVTYQGEVAYRDIPQLSYSVPLITFLNSDRNSKIYDVVFSGQTTEEPIQIYLQYRHFEPCHLDSITFTSPYFKQIWSGNSFDKTPPPKMLLPGNDYLLTILYTRPEDKPFKREFMIFHYAGGLKRRLELVTQEYDVPVIKTLELISPVGGENFAPCQDVLIEWRGQAVAHPVILSFSSDGGNKWEPIDTIDGKEYKYLWKVPQTLTTNGIVKVSQVFHRNRTLSLYYDSSRVNAAEFNFQSTKVVTVNSSGMVVEWDLYSQDEPAAITTIYIDDNSNYLDAKYIDDEKFIILRDKNEITDILLCRSSNSNNIEKNIKLVDNFRAKKVLIDSLKRFIALCPSKYSNKIQFIDTGGNFIKYYINEKTPIVDIVYNYGSNIMYVALLDNTIKLLSLDEFPKIKEIDVYKFSKYLNLISSLSVSQNGRFLGLSLNSAGKSKIEKIANENYIFDNETKTLFRKIMCSEETPLGSGFNPTGNICVFAHRGEFGGQSQISFFDLTGKLGFGTTFFSDFLPRDLLGFTLSSNTNSLIEYSAGENNCLLVNFSLPESVQNLTGFTIEYPKMEITSIHINDNLIIGTSNDYEYEMVFCNKGKTDAVFENYYFKSGEHFEFTVKNIPDTIKVGECKTVYVTVLPLDTGYIKDSIIFESCNHNYEIPISLNARDRNLLYLQNNPVDLGEICVWETSINKIALFKNMDTVPILINRVETLPNNEIYVIDYPKDTLLQPGEIYEIDIWFTPDKFGEIYSKLFIYHSNQEHVIYSIDLKGFGIGTDLELSHMQLYFMPEIKERTLTIVNLGNSSLLIDSINIVPNGTYKINNTLPIYVNSKEKIELLVEYIGDEPQKASMNFIATPCTIVRNIELGKYAASVNLEIPTVQADPLEMDINIPLNFKRQENVAYKDTCIFIANLEINPRIFYPTRVESNFGKAEIIANDVIKNTDKRNFKIKIEGDFYKSNGVLAQIYGIAGLCEVDSSCIAIVKDSDFWGKSVDVKTKDGMFKLINLCGNRRITREEKFVLENLFPNPVNDKINLYYEILEPINTDINFEIYDIYGNKILTKKIISAGLGKDNCSFLVDFLSIGTYNISIKYEDVTKNYVLTILR